MDPTEIIAVPYDVQRLSIYVAAVACAVLIEPGGWWRIRFTQLLILSAVCTGVFVLCGASPYINTVHTVLAATYFATLCWFDPPIFDATSDDRMTKTLGDQFLQRLRRRHGDSTCKATLQQDFLAQIILYSCVSFTVPMQILLLYDRGWQVQRWPVPVILGCSIGWIVGTSLGAILATRKLSRFSNKKKDEDTPDKSLIVADTSIERKD